MIPKAGRLVTMKTKEGRMCTGPAEDISWREVAWWRYTEIPPSLWHEWPPVGDPQAAGVLVQPGDAVAWGQVDRFRAAGSRVWLYMVPCEAEPDVEVVRRYLDKKTGQIYETLVEVRGDRRDARIREAVAEMEGMIREGRGHEEILGQIRKIAAL